MEHKNKNNNKDAGFTLMELLVVILILGLLAAIAVPQVVKYLSRAKADTAKLQVESLVANLDFYKIDVGAYPTTEQGLKALVEKPGEASNWFGPYIKKKSSLVDPWGEPYQYKMPGDHGFFDIYSYGADKKEGGEGENADIVSWED
ncbi:type II secretion system major pseudopilin GspG [Emcibacter nanhaiensis]|nr:type II secretion system major pseudopilin GspG [Emcibacter nanhaiensis]